MSSSPSGERDSATAARLELARARSLAAVAATIAHDLNNQLNAALGLAARLRPLVTDVGDHALLARLEAGTKAGARMASVLARMLGKGGRERVTIAAEELLEDALAIARRSIENHGIELQVACAERLPPVRTVATEASQAVLQGLMALLSSMPKSIVVSMTAESFAIADGRDRLAVAVRCEARQMSAESVTALLVVAGAQAGMMQQVAADPQSFMGFAGAVLIQRRLGGDLLAERLSDDLHDGVRLTYVWPAAVGDGGQ